MSNKIITFGCRLNNYESQVIKEEVNKAGVSDVIVFNTCAVTKEASRQAYQAIRKEKRRFPEKKIIVTGCAAQLNPEKFAQMIEVDRVLGNEEKMNYASYQLVDKILVDDIMKIKETAEHLVTNFEGKSRCFVQIQNGCNHRCTFCIIPYARGNNRSVPIGAIVTQVKKLVDCGYKEVVLTGVDISDYGLDLPGSPSLANMITRLLKLVPNLPRLRLSSIDVAEIDEELFGLLSQEPRIMPHVHISLQSGDNMILKRMKRRHKRENVIEFCHKLRSQREDIAFGADIIAGFPTETDEMFENSLNLISESSIQYLHIFPYSQQEKTPAAKMPQVAKQIIKERAAKLRKEGSKELKKFLTNQVGKTFKSIIETDNIARSENFIAINLMEKADIGEIYDIKILAYKDDKLIGEKCPG